jgi:hypothetical protein
MCGLLVSPKFLEHGRGFECLLCTIFAWCGSYAGGVGYWAGVVTGCAGVGGPQGNS